MGENKKYSKTLKSALDSACEVLRIHFNKGITEKLKEHSDPVTQADLDSQKAIIKIIKKKYPEHHIISEELKGSHELSKDHTWIIDPLDGTSNFVNGIEFHSVAIAVYRGKEIIAGGIALPQLNQTYLAFKGEGATLNGKKITVSRKEDLRKALVIPAVQARDPRQLEAYRSWGLKLLSNIRSYRAFGTSAMDWAYLSAGKIDGYARQYIPVWDACAGVILAREAGGVVWTFEGKDWNYGDTSVIAGNEAIVRSIYNAIR